MILPRRWMKSNCDRFSRQTSLMPSSKCRSGASLSSDGGGGHLLFRSFGASFGTRYSGEDDSRAPRRFQPLVSADIACERLSSLCQTLLGHRPRGSAKRAIRSYLRWEVIIGLYSLLTLGLSDSVVLCGVSLAFSRANSGVAGTEHAFLATKPSLRNEYVWKQREHS